MVYTQERKKILYSLIEEINNFDSYFEMSDSNSIYSKGYHNKYVIIAKLKDLTYSEKQLIINKLNNNGKISWNRYFK